MIYGGFYVYIYWLMMENVSKSVISSMIFKSVLKSCVIRLMVHKFYIKSIVIQSYEFTNKFDVIMDLNGFVCLFFC